MKATLRQYRQSPRKVRLLANLVKGKGVNRAISELQYTPKRASKTITKLIESAVANAKGVGKDQKDLFVKEVQVNEGKTLYRVLPMSRGRAFRIRKRTSHIDLVLGEKKKGDDSKTEEKKTIKQSKKVEASNEKTKVKPKS